MKPAFSTVACPDWTLTQLASRAEHWGFLGVEFRTFGSGGTLLACEPGLTDPAKTRSLFARAGVTPVSLATSIRFDDPVTPPVIGHLFDHEQCLREAKGAVSLAVQLECPFVRVFGFEVFGSESRSSALVRITDRLAKAADHCDRSGVRLVVENGGSFRSAVDLAEIIDRVGSPLVCASYSLPVGASVGETARDAANVLGDRLVVVKVKDMLKGTPCLLGEGELHAAEHVKALSAAGYTGWLVYEHDRLWFKDAPDAERALSHGAKTMFGWLGATARARAAV